MALIASVFAVGLSDSEDRCLWEVFTTVAVAVLVEPAGFHPIDWHLSCQLVRKRPSSAAQCQTDRNISLAKDGQIEYRIIENFCGKLRFSISVSVGTWMGGSMEQWRTRQKDGYRGFLRLLPDARETRDSRQPSSRLGGRSRRAGVLPIAPHSTPHLSQYPSVRCGRGR